MGSASSLSLAVPPLSQYDDPCPCGACWCCPGQRPSAYAALRREYPCLDRAYAQLEERLGVGGYWAPVVREHGRRSAYCAPGAAPRRAEAPRTRAARSCTTCGFR